MARFNEVDSDPSFSTGDNQGVFDEKEIGGVVEDVRKKSPKNILTRSTNRWQEDVLFAIYLF